MWDTHVLRLGTLEPGATFLREVSGRNICEGQQGTPEEIGPIFCYFPVGDVSETETRQERIPTSPGFVSSLRVVH